MKNTFLKVSLACGAFLALGTSVAFATEGTSLQQRLTTGFVKAIGTSVGKNIKIEKNAGENASGSSSRPQPFLFTDNIKEFEQLKNKEISDFRTKKLEELHQKKEEIKAQRKACQESLTALSSARKTARAELLKTCKPTFTGEPNTKEEKLARYQQIKDAMVACKAKLKEFEVETKTQVTDTRSQCFTTERKVLGLSTLVPYDQQ